MDTAAALQIAHDIDEFRSGPLGLYGPTADAIADVWHGLMAGDSSALQLLGNLEPPRQSRPFYAGNVVVIPLRGPISHRQSVVLQLLFDATSAMTFRANLQAAVSDPYAKAIAIDVDSPGGSIQGVIEVAQTIRDARREKPISAVIDTAAYSIAYALAAQASRVVVTRSANVGSIGVVSLHEDKSRRLEMQGRKFTFISAGLHKLEASPFGPLSDDDRAAMQEWVSYLHELMVKEIALGRGVSPAKVREGFGQGRILGADDAVRAGMADAIGSLDNEIARLQAMAQRPRLARAERAFGGAA